jgi:pimeloyl-ACP methyl ester carboxylesterase
MEAVSWRPCSPDTSVQLHWTSAYDGFGTSSLARDVSELHALASHLRDGNTKTVVVMGHSTGSQDVIHLLTTLGGVDGGIMQAPVSDREHFGIDPTTKAWTDMLPTATAMVDEGRGDELLPPAFAKEAGMKMTAYRLWSLLSPR